jgi:hypothetical protein
MHFTNSAIYSKLVPSTVSLIILMASVSCQWASRGRDLPVPDPAGFQVIQTNEEMAGTRSLTLTFYKGRAHNHPLMAAWIEDTAGNYLQTVYVAESIAKGVFRHGDPSTGRWMPGPLRRPAALPYWGHQRGIKAEDGLFIPHPNDPLPDALTGPTPKSNFVLKTNLKPGIAIPFRVLFEINQSWDWNHYWTNDKFPGDAEYMTSSQPAVVYEALITSWSRENGILMRPIGHSHWSGKTGELFSDLSTLTTALEIAARITINITED